jgi:hypothetical protein
MRGLIRSAFCALAGSLAIAGAAHAAAPDTASFDMAGIVSPDRTGGPSNTVDLSQSFALPSLTYGPPDTSRETVSNLVSSVALVEGIDLQVGYHVDLTGHVVASDTVNSSSVNGLFLSAATLNSPYASLASGGDFVGATVALADDLHLSVGSANLAPGYSNYSRDAAATLARVGSGANPFSLRAATSLLGGLSWDIGKWAGIGVTASQTSERGGVLGTAVSGVNANTSAVDFSARVQLGAGWVTSASYSEGITQLDLKPGFSPALAGDSLRTRSYGIAIAKNGLFGDDALGLAVSRPAFNADGTSYITVPASPGRPQFFSRSNLLEGATPETDIEVGYVTTFLDGALALQTNASYQMNFAGQNGANSVSLLSRARIKF